METFSSTMKNYKNKNIENILDTTFTLIVEKGIMNVTFNEIAKKSNIGVASIYRYFKNKNNLISNCAVEKLSLLTNQVTEIVNNIDFKEKTAIEEFEELLNCYVIFFKDNKSFLKFLAEFDNYFTYNKMDTETENTYNELYKSFYKIAKEIYKKGLIDTTFKNIDDFDAFYFSITSSLLQTCIKGAVNPTIIPLDSLITTENKIDTLIKVAISYCKRS